MEMSSVLLLALAQTFPSSSQAFPWLKEAVNFSLNALFFSGHVHEQIKTPAHMHVTTLTHTDKVINLVKLPTKHRK